jgi:hypothetical protein
VPYAEGFFGSGVLWMLLTYPAYWFFQWLVEREPFYLFSRRSFCDSSALVTPEVAQAATAAITE